MYLDRDFAIRGMESLAFVCPTHDRVHTCSANALEPLSKSAMLALKWPFTWDATPYGKRRSRSLIVLKLCDPSNSSRPLSMSDVQPGDSSSVFDVDSLPTP